LRLSKYNDALISFSFSENEDDEDEDDEENGDDILDLEREEVGVVVGMLIKKLVSIGVVELL